MSVYHRNEITSANTQQNVFDLDGTLRRLGGDTGLLADLVQLYAEDSPDLLRRLAAGIELGQSDQVRRAAHSLRGLAANFGAADLTGILHRLEDNSAANHLEGAPELLKMAQQESVRLQSALARYSR
jgi:HPt (histidine-containing phosphotransfer) domain-containing protein